MKRIANDAHELQRPDIWSACRKGDKRAVQQAIEQHISLIHEPDPHEGRPPLFLASRSGHGLIVKLLLEAGARDRDGTAFAVSNNAHVRQLLRVYDTRTASHFQQNITTIHSPAVFDSQMAAIEHLKRASTRLIVERDDSTIMIAPQQRQKDKPKGATIKATGPVRGMMKLNQNKPTLARSSSDQVQCERLSDRIDSANIQKKKSCSSIYSLNCFRRKTKVASKRNVTTNNLDNHAMIQTKKVANSKTLLSVDQSEKRVITETGSTDENGHVKLYFYKLKQQNQPSSHASSVVDSSDKIQKRPVNETASQLAASTITLMSTYTAGKVIKARRPDLLSKPYKIRQQTTASEDKCPMAPSNLTSSLVGSKAKSTKRVTFSVNLESFHWDEVTERTEEMSLPDSDEWGRQTDDLESQSEMSDASEDNIVEDIIFGMSLIVDDIVRDGPQVVREAMYACFPNDAIPSAIY